MENQDYARYEIKLNRWFNIQAKQNLILLAVLLVLEIAYTVFNNISNHGSWQASVLFCGGCSVIMIAALFSNPKRFELTPDTVRFQYHRVLLHLILSGRVQISSNNPTRYQSAYTIYNIRSIEYLQTPLEKWFSCGHIRICGDVNTNEISPRHRTFTIYGFKDFENTSAWMKEFVQLSDDT